MSGSNPAMVEKALQILEADEQEMILMLQELVRIPSLEAEAAPNAPFGLENRRALDYVLERSAKLGLVTTDMDGYCGYAEFGSGEKMVMSMGHLDVVPVGPGWKYPEFGAEIHDGYLYGRGATDDKGPTVAMFFAAKAVKESYPDLKVRVRQLFGCNEESGFLCVEHYMKTGEVPTLGVAPDAGWPLIHAEKGIANLILRSKPIGKLVRLTKIEGGQRPNIVIDHCVAEVQCDPSFKPSMEEAIAKNWDRNLTFTWNENQLEIEAIGKAAHGSRPYSGDNAAARILRFLKDAVPVDEQDQYGKFFDFTHPSGHYLGLLGADELTSLTTNLGIISGDETGVTMTINIRYPVTWKGDVLVGKCEPFLGDDWSVKEIVYDDPLYFPLDHPLVGAIVKAVKDETGEDLKPKTMGGGTYARAVPNCVAIGTFWAGDGPAHETDERVKVAHLLRAARIYVRILFAMIDCAEAMA